MLPILSIIVVALGAATRAAAQTPLPVNYVLDVPNSGVGSLMNDPWRDELAVWRCRR